MGKIKGKIYKTINPENHKEFMICMCTEDELNSKFCGVVLETNIIGDIEIGNHYEDLDASIFNEYIGQLDLNNVFHESNK